MVEALRNLHPYIEREIEIELLKDRETYSWFIVNNENACLNYTTELRELLLAYLRASQTAAVDISRNKEVFKNQLRAIRKEKKGLRKFQRNFRSWLGQTLEEIE